MKQEVKLRSMDLMVTTRCNLDCKNCFGHMDPYKDVDMDMSTAKSATHFYFKNKMDDDPRGSCIVLFGGEPTMDWDFVENYVKWVQKDYPRNKYNYSTTIFTNGVDVSTGMIDFLIENDVGIAISFDGPYSQHVIRRDMDREEYNNIVNTIKYIVKKGYANSLLISTVISKDSLQLLPDYFPLYEGLGVERFQFIHDTDKEWSPEDREKLRKIITEYKSKHPEMGIYLCPEYAFNCDTCVPSTILVYPNGDVWDMCTLSTSALYRQGKISKEESRVTYFGNLNKNLKKLEIDLAEKVKIVRPHMFCPTLSRDWKGLLKDFGKE